MKQSIYSPFMKLWTYFDRMFNERQYQLPKFFPKNNIENKVICVSGVGSKTFSVLMTDLVPCYDFLEKSQCFPLYHFDNGADEDQQSFMKNKRPECNITDSALNRFKNHYKNPAFAKKLDISDFRKPPAGLEKEALSQFPVSKTGQGGCGLSAAGGAIETSFKITAENSNKISIKENSPAEINGNKSGPLGLTERRKSPDSIAKEDIFYYIYGLLHSEDYRERYKSNLDKDLPRIPLVPEFWEFSGIGRKLADLHLKYENQAPPKEVKVLKDGKAISLSDSLFSAQNSGRQKSLRLVGSNKTSLLPEGLAPEDLKVRKMKIDKKDNSKIQFNDSLTVVDIPPEAWEYKFNGRPAPKWIVNRYQLKRDKKTDLVNDPNAYSDDPAYILKLLLSAITVSLKTRELVQSLPSIDFDSLISSMKKTG